MPPSSHRRRGVRFFHPLVEQLEDRRLLAAVITVNSTADTNARDAILTLREAILINNRALPVASLSPLEQAQISGTPTNSDADTINFGIVGVGVQTISPTSALPNITDPVTINGYSQLGANANTNSPAQTLNTVLQIELAGTLSGGATGLRLGAGSSGSTIRGLAINRFSNGIWIDSSGNTIAGNFIGTNPAGSAAAANTANGILIISGTSNTIGGTSPADNNVISGNATNGITIVTAPAPGNTIQGNRIGTDLTGAVDLGNTVYGVLANQSPSTTIGGSVVGAGNLISGNNSHGILLQDGSNSSVVQGNKIGTTLTASAALTNGGDGVRIETSSHITVGGVPGGNTIAFNTGTGIRDAGNFNSLFQANSIFGNGALGIDRGITTGETYPPTSEALPYPILTEVSEAGGVTTVKGLHSSPSNQRLEFFANAQADPTGFGEGQTYLGSLIVSTSGSTSQFFTATLPALPVGQPLVTATVTDITVTGGTPANVTSEFSPPLSAAMTPTVFRVTTTADSGPGSLRDAIIATNSHAGPDRIEFNIPASDPGHVYYKDDGVDGQVTPTNATVTTATDDATIAGMDPDWPHSWFTIKPTSPLPEITDPLLTIDGYTQSGSVQNSNPTTQGLNSVLKVEIDGEANENTGSSSSGVLRFAGGLSGDSTVRGLVLNRAFNSSGSVPLIGLSGGLGNYKVEGSYLGTDVSGSLALAAIIPGGSSGAGFVSVGASDTTIGGTSPAARNLVTSVVIPSGAASAQRTLVEGNLVGTNRGGSTGLAGGGSIGDGGTDTVIGGSDLAARNVIAGGVVLGTRSLLQNNLIGTDITGAARTSPAGVGSVGVAVGGDDSRVLQNTVAFFGANIGGTETGGGVAVAGQRNQIEQNSIFSNIGSGISVTGSQALLSQNSIYDNTGIGIDLVQAGDSTGGVTLNDLPPDSDPPDQDTGPNALQNYPVLTSVTATGGATHIEGTLASTPSSNFRLEFFANTDRDDASGGLVADGEIYFGMLDVTTNASGNASFAADFPVNLLTLPGANGQPYVSATASDITDAGSGPRNNTSEFSFAFPLGGPSTVVTSTADSGLGSLREAILNANFTPGPQTITFAIPVTDPRHFYYRDDGIAGEVTFENTTATMAADDATIADIDPDWPHSWFNILLATELPAITDTITIDGYSQPGSSRNTRAFPDPSLDTVLKIELDGRNVAGDGLNLSWSSPTQSSDGSMIQGLSINAFVRHGILARTLGGGNTIAGNFIGPDISGLLNFGNGGDGVFVAIEGDTTIGGPDAAYRNIVSGNDAGQIEILGWAGGLVEGNNLNGNRTGNTFFQTNGPGIYVSNDEARLPDTLDQRKVDSLSQPTTQQENSENYTIKRTVFVTRFSRLDEGLENGVVIAYGPRSSGKAQSTVGEILSAEVNNFQNRYVSKSGSPSSNNRLREAVNATAGTVTGIRYLGIDIGGDGVTPNDPGDADDGPNDLQNYPVVASATASGSGVTCVASLDSLPSKQFRIEFYASSYDTDVFRAGEQSIGTMDVTTDASGHASFVYQSSQALPVGYHVLALATRLEDLDNDPSTPLEPYGTSEFSAGTVVRDNPWFNKAQPLDANPDGKIVPQDALVIINYINAHGAGLIPPDVNPGDPYYYDTSDDAYVSPIDALLVINHINRFGADAEGKHAPPQPALGLTSDQPVSEALLWALATNIASQRKRHGNLSHGA
jgi:hypothetical protein